MDSEKTELSEIIEKHPSICWGCENARKPASDENTKKGYVGCCIRALHGSKVYDFTEINEADEIGEGWVDLKSQVKLGKGSGIITNMQLLTKGVKSCKQFDFKES